MKRLIELQSPVQGWDGKPLQSKTPMIGKELLLTYVSMYVSSDKKEVFMAINIGQKIFLSTGPELEIEDAEYEFLMKATVEARHSVLGMAQVYRVMGVTE